MCPYAYYKKINEYGKEVIYCKKKNDLCPFIRYCNKVNKIIQSESYEECKIKNMIKIPIGASAVRKKVSNEKYLYVDIEENGKNYTYKLTNPYDEIPDYVYIEKTDKGYKIKT